METNGKESVCDYVLIQEYLAGNAGSFDLLYERYRRPIYGYLAKMLCGRNTVLDDLFQQTWVKAIDSFGRYEERQLFLAWILRIAHNLAIDVFRRESKAPEAPGAADPDAPDPVQGIADSGATPLGEMKNKELGSAINLALDRISPELREVFLLRMDDVPFREIAEIQKCSINTVLARMQYAMKNMRKLLSEYMD